MIKSSAFFILGLSVALLLVGGTALWDFHLQSQLHELEVKCVEEGHREFPAKESAGHFVPTCDAASLALLDDLIGIQAEIHAKFNQRRHSQGWPFLVSAVVALISGIPWFWYFLLRRIRELREAIVASNIPLTHYTDHLSMPQMHTSPHAIFLDQYKVAAGEGAFVELKLRLLADKIPSLQKYTHAQKLEDIETEVAAHFRYALSEEDKKTLALCRQLRNKILHCNFSAAREKLAELGIEQQSGGVRRVDLARMSSPEILLKVKDAIAGEPGTSVPVVASPTTTAGSVFGWLIEVGNAGDLVAAANAFRGASVIVDRLAVVRSAA